MTDWRSVYSERFLARAIQRPPRVYTRTFTAAELTDEQIDQFFPEGMRPFMRLCRDLNRTMSETTSRIAAALGEPRGR